MKGDRLWLEAVQEYPEPPETARGRSDKTGHTIPPGHEGRRGGIRVRVMVRGMFGG
jgi:hypothetical protein